MHAQRAQATNPDRLVQPNPELKVGSTCTTLETIVPPHFEESLEDIVDKL